ncbi:MAG: phage holin family protein [Methylotenera sp.]|nr:phage holin family protein [Oligoflexia bacterium]
MYSILITWFVAALSLLGTAYFLPGFKVAGFKSALITAVVIGLANILVRPILLFLTLPLNILTLGLFTIVVNAMILKLCAALTPGFEIKSWLTAILASILIALLSNGMYWLLSAT